MQKPIKNIMIKQFFTNTNYNIFYNNTCPTDALRLNSLLVIKIQNRLQLT